MAEKETIRHFVTVIGIFYTYEACEEGFEKAVEYADDYIDRVISRAIDEITKHSIHADKELLIKIIKAKI